MAMIDKNNNDIHVFRGGFRHSKMEGTATFLFIKLLHLLSETSGESVMFLLCEILL